ncbi:hypothetical protein Dimus_018418 [Dionaea muscipula]
MVSGVVSPPMTPGDATTIVVPDLNGIDHTDATSNLPQEVAGTGTDLSGKNLANTAEAEPAAITTPTFARADPSVDNEKEIEKMQAALDQAQAVREQLLENPSSLPQNPTPPSALTNYDSDSYHSVHEDHSSGSSTLP